MEMRRPSGEDWAALIIMLASGVAIFAVAIVALFYIGKGIVEWLT